MMSGSDRRIVLLTGAAGRIGSAFRRAHGHDYHFRLADVRNVRLADTPGDGHEVLWLDVADAAACAAACAGIDTVIHLAADPSPEAEWEGSLLDNNIRGVVNVFRAASEAGCRRAIFASSVHAIGGYPPDTPIPDDAPPRPTNLYGASKAFGEAVAATYSTTGLSGIAIRIGAYDAPWFYEERDPIAATAYVSPRDLNQLLIRCIETPDIPYAVVAGVSANRRNRFDLVNTRLLLGYAPRDDGFAVLGLPEDD
jgi:nucleoside-diphosphate-sugar epimerase